VVRRHVTLAFLLDLVAPEDGDVDEHGEDVHEHVDDLRAIQRDDVARV